MDLTKVPLNEYGHVQTRDGRPVRLLCVDAKREYSLVGLVMERGGSEYVLAWAKTGQCELNDSKGDLSPVPRKVRIKGCFVCSADHSVEWVPDVEPDDMKPAFAILPVDREVTEGEGL